MTPPKLTPDILLRAYAAGIFPMAEARDATEIHWMEPRHRGIFPLNGFHISRSLSRHILRGGFHVTINSDFSAVMAACADRETTWINAEITQAYTALHRMGHAHSVEVWADSGDLIGGVYGVQIGAAFMGESMFSCATNASKTALAYLVHRLRAGGFQLFDTQYLTPHLASLGAVEIPQSVYKSRLSAAIGRAASFDPAGYQPLSSSVAGAASG